jgi:hypothetical protein
MIADQIAKNIANQLQGAKSMIDDLLPSTVRCKKYNIRQNRTIYSPSTVRYEKIGGRQLCGNLFAISYKV